MSVNWEWLSDCLMSLLASWKRLSASPRERRNGELEERAKRDLNVAPSCEEIASEKRFRYSVILL